MQGTFDGICTRYTLLDRDIVARVDLTMTIKHADLQVSMTANVCPTATYHKGREWEGEPHCLLSTVLFNLVSRCVNRLLVAVPVPQPSSTHLATWEIAIAVVGSLLGILVFVALALLWWKRRKANKHQYLKVGFASCNQQHVTFMTACSAA